MLSNALLLVAVVAVSGAQAAITMKAPSTKIDLENSKGGSTKKFKEVKGITDAELRAQAGSRSRYSLNASLSYLGAPLEDAFGEDLPNPDNSLGDHKTVLSGSMAARYRLDKSASLGFGTGINVLTPFHGAERVDVRDPYLSHTKLYRLGYFQALTDIKATYITNPRYVDVGEFAGLSLYQSQKINLEGGRWSVGFAFAFSAYAYNRSYDSKDGNASNYNASLHPKVTYKIADNLALKSSLSLGVRSARKYGDWGTVDEKTLTQKLGLGYAYTKDIFLNPYLYLYPAEFTWAETSLSFNAIFSVF